MTKRFRKKSTRILLAAEFLFVLLIFTAAVRGRQEGESKVYSLDYASLYADKGVSMETFPYSAFSGIYLDNSLMDDGEKELAVKTPLLPLSPGAYRVDVVYSTGDSGNYLSVQSGERYLSTADKAHIMLPAGADRTESVTLRTFFSMEDLSISVHYPGNGYLFVSGVTVTRIPGFPWPFLVCGIELFAVLHIFLFLWQRYGECGGGKRKILTFLLGLSVAVSLPIFSVYLGTGDDLEYHLLRIDALAEGLRDGQFPVRVSSYWNNGYGYGSSLYYCDFFLLFPALLRIGGLSAQSAYKQYLFAVNFLTAALCWYSFRKIGSRRSAALGTILYTFLPYRILCLYRRAAVGEYTAMAFLPLAAAGIYQIYTAALPQARMKQWKNADAAKTGDRAPNAGGSKTTSIAVNAGSDITANTTPKASGLSILKEEIRVILPAVLGFSGLILSHIITTFFAVITVIIVLLIRIRKTLKPAVLKRLAGTIVLTFALCAWFVIPFADSMRNDIGTMQETQETASIEEYGTYISQLMDFFPSAAGGNISTKDEPAARQNGTPDIVYSAGVALYGTVLWIAYGMIHRKNRTENEAIEENRQADSQDNGNRRENKEAARYRFSKENETVRDSSGSDADGRTLGNIAAWAGLICAFMSTVWFPWNSIAAAAPALNQIVRNIQFPWRILSLAGIFMVIATVELSEKLKSYEPAENAEKVLAVSLVAAALISGLFLLHDYTVSTNVRNYTGTPAVDTTGIAGAEYLPVGTDTAIFAAQAPVPGEGVTIETAERDGGTWRVTVSSADGSDAGGDGTPERVDAGGDGTSESADAGGDDISEGGSYMDVPFLYYPGYIGKDAKTHQRFIAVPGSGGRARIELPEGYQGTIEIRYSERKLWRGAELLSVITVILLSFILKGRTKRVKSITWRA